MRNKAVFLDRDGTVIREVNLLRNLGQLRILPSAIRGIRKINKLGFFAIIITNQPVVARGWVTESEVKLIHKTLINRLRIKGAKIDGVYYCPHHPNANLKKYRLTCRCRKPNTGLFKKAAGDFKLNMKKSFVIGDMSQDILAGKRIGARTILVKTGYGGKDGKYETKPDFIAKNLDKAADIIKKYEKRN